MNTLPMDLERAKFRILLEDLAFEKLDIDGAIELRPLLIKEAKHTDNMRYKKILLKLIDTVDKYIKGEINLRRDIDVPISI